jgi:predicted nucleic acid-binding protein
VIVPDSSAWIEFFRRTESPVDLTLNRLIEDGADLALTEVVLMEVLAEARSDRHRDELREGLMRYPLLTLRPLDGYEEAAKLYRMCRAGGETIRKMTDCLVAVPAIEAGASVLHNDSDFDALARHTALRIEPASA